MACFGVGGVEVVVLGAPESDAVHAGRERVPREDEERRLGPLGSSGGHRAQPVARGGAAVGVVGHRVVVGLCEEHVEVGLGLVSERVPEEVHVLEPRRG